MVVVIFFFLPVLCLLLISLFLILPDILPEFFSPKRVRLREIHTFMHRLAQKHKLSLLMDWLPPFLSFIFTALLFLSAASPPRWGLTPRQPPQTLVSIMWYPCFVTLFHNPRGSHLSAIMPQESLQHVSHSHLYPLLPCSNGQISLLWGSM